MLLGKIPATNGLRDQFTAQVRVTPSANGGDALINNDSDDLGIKCPDQKMISTRAVLS